MYTYATRSINKERSVKYDDNIPRFNKYIYPKMIDEVKSPNDDAETLRDYEEVHPEEKLPYKIYGSRLPGGKYRLTHASIDNVYSGMVNVNYAGIVDMENQLIHLLPSGRKDDEQYIGAKHPGPTFRVQTRDNSIEDYDIEHAPKASGIGTDLITMHEKAANMVAGRSPDSKSKEGNQNLLGFSFALEIDQKTNDGAGRYMLRHFHARSRSLNAIKSPDVPDSKIFAADYLMFGNDSGNAIKLDYKPVEEHKYRRLNAEYAQNNPGARGARQLYGMPRKAAQATLSQTIRKEIIAVILKGLTESEKYDLPANAKKAEAIQEVAKEWNVRVRPPRNQPTLPAPTSRSATPDTSGQQRVRRPSVSRIASAFLTVFGHHNRYQF